MPIALDVSVPLKGSFVLDLLAELRGDMSHVSVPLKGSFVLNLNSAVITVPGRYVSVPLKGSFVLNICYPTIYPSTQSFRPLKGVFCFKFVLMARPRYILMFPSP